MRTRVLVQAVIVGTLTASATATAAPIALSGPFLQLSTVAENSLGFATGPRIRFGASSVIPDGDDASPTTGTALTTNTVTGASVSRSITFNPDTVSPHFFSRTIADDPALHGPWTLRFTNGPDTREATLSLPASAAHIPFITNVRISGDSFNPTFSWDAPVGAIVNGFRVNIYDKDRLTSTGRVDGVFSQNLTTPSFTIPSALAGGLALDGTHRYSLEISALSTRDGGSTSLSNSNVYAISRSYFDFRPVTGTAPEVNLPVITSDGAYRFDVPVLGGEVVYIDPDIAVGYDYAIGIGDPKFRSVILPVGIGDGLYDIFALDDLGFATLLASDFVGGSIFDFGVDGLAHFRVGGIEASAGLDPANPTAFITGLTFVGDGRFTGTQRPIVVAVPDVPSDVPAPAMAVVLLASLVLYRLHRQRERLDWTVS